MHKATSTGRMRKHYLTGEEAPLVELPRFKLGTPEYQRDLGDLHPLAEVDGQVGYVADDGSGEEGVWLEAVFVDAGGNEIRRRRAPQGLNGIAAPLRGQHGGHVVHEGLLAWVQRKKVA